MSIHLEKLTVSLRIMTLASIISGSVYVGGRIEKFTKQQQELKDAVKFVNQYKAQIVKIDCLEVRINRHLYEDAIQNAKASQQLQDSKDE